MTVAELIEKLQEMPQEFPVVTVDDTGTLDEVASVYVTDNESVIIL